jgi:hypothetical protein
VGTWRTAREEPDSPSVLRVLCEFLRVFHSIHFVGGFCCTKFADSPYLSAERSVTGRTVRGPIVDGPLLRVQYWRLGGYFRTVRRSLADGPLGACGWS